MPALHEAAQAGNAAEVKVRLSQPGCDVNQLDPGRSTALMWASMSGDVTTVKVLIEAKAAVDMSNGNATALHFAALNGHRGVVDALLEVGANACIRADGGKTAADAAREEGHIELAKLLDKAIAAGPPLPGGKAKPTTLEGWIDYFMQDGNVSLEDATDLAEMEMM